ncbi:PRC-barrel domain-containing protein [Roseomonas rosea]|uniref:PRC-barrel domain-containing protein n=1 Tax=Muricoccus roseus TaxID=198092 RepID=A0A1M6B139_9PROT|nr:PRC-barrel domain-containing protein [Roseomonas rosea]SHI42298.1 PRC-barrel domain-containing protein [Roseomonas rosea]
MTTRTYKSTLMGLTAAAALLAVPALAQTQAQPQTQAQTRDGTPGNPPSTATQRAADQATGNRTAPDGTPGNPPGTALGRAVDRAGDNAAGANQRAGDPLNTQNRPDGTPGNPPGTALGRAADRTADGAADANRRAGDPLNTQDRPDGAAGNPPGTAVTRGLDRALGTNMSGAFPQNEQPATDGTRATVTGRDAAATDSGRSNEPAAANANPGAMGTTGSQPRASGAQGQAGMPGPVNRTPEGDQARAGTANVPLQNQAAGNAPANPSGPNGANRPASATAANSAATAPAAQTDRVSRIIGSNVYNERNESIGSVDDVILPSGGSSPMAIVSVGGFLGIGAKLVAVPMSELRWSAADNRWTITGATRESLTSLPAYSYDAARRG